MSKKPENFSQNEKIDEGGEGRTGHTRSQPKGNNCRGSIHRARQGRNELRPYEKFLFDGIWVSGGVNPFTFFLFPVPGWFTGDKYCGNNEFDISGDRADTGTTRRQQKNHEPA
jgi:hypothetical protein